MQKNKAFSWKYMFDRNKPEDKTSPKHKHNDIETPEDLLNEIDYLITSKLDEYKEELKEEISTAAAEKLINAVYEEEGKKADSQNSPKDGLKALEIGEIKEQPEPQENLFRRMGFGK